MKVIHLLPCLLCLLAVACSQENNNTDIDISPEMKTRAVTLDANGEDDVAVFIFKKDDNGFMHLSTINSGWDQNGRTTVNLENGDYKFLFHKSGNLNCDIFPAEMTPQAAFEHVKWNCRLDEVNGEGYMLPVDEIWLPETFDMANLPYTIQAATTVSNTLTRAVSQVVVHFRNGTPEEPGTRAGGILTRAANFGTLDIEIEGVGESASVNGGIGYTKTRVLLDEPLTDETITSFTGPFVFPSETGDDAIVTITYTPGPDSTIPGFTKIVNGPLERNRKLEVTFWTEEPGEDGTLTVSVDTTEMEDYDEGDNGIWE